MAKRYEWDKAKAAANALDYWVTFGEAQTVFVDDHAGIGPDPDHSSAGEDREIMVGHSKRSRLMLISFVEHGDVVRIISARLLTRLERGLYEEKKLP